MLKFYQYEKCSTCRNAKKLLESKGVSFQSIDITLNPPSLEELQSFLKKSGKPLKDFLNRSGEKYRELNMKEKIQTLSENEVLEMMANEGRLIKRPIVTDGKKVTVGFNEEEFHEVW